MKKHSRKDASKSGWNTKKTGKYRGKSNELGHGGRAAQMKAHGVPGGVIGAIARAKGAAPGGPHYHGKHARKHDARRHEGHKSYAHKGHSHKSHKAMKACKM
jgi:hypothetical protein